MRRQFRIRSQPHTAVFHVRTRDVEFKGIHPGIVVEGFDDLYVVFLSAACHIAQHPGVILRQKRQLVFNHILHAFVLQANGIQHAHGCIRHPRGRVAFPGCGGYRLDGNAAQQREIVQLCVFPAIAEAAGGRNHRVFQVQTREPDRKIHYFHHSITSPIRNTGPSLQTRSCEPSGVFTTQPMQAPRPQAMRLSSDT